MTTTKAATNELPPLFISPLYSDCTIQVPLDDRSGFYTYNLHLCMLYESPYFRKGFPNPIQVHVPTLKSHFEIILRYIYHRNQIYYNDENILDLITEGYRFSLDDFVDQLWSVFATNATAKMVIDALKRMENQHEFHRSWDKYYLQTAIKRNILSIMDAIDELKSFSSIQLLLCSARNQNPNAIFKKVLTWGAMHQGTIYVGIVRNLYDTRVGRHRKKNGCSGKPNHLFSARQFSKDIRCYKTEISFMVPLPCVIDTTVTFVYGDLTIQSISPLKVIFCPELYNIENFIFRLWDKERTFYITKSGKDGGKLEYNIMNALEWATENKLQFEIIKCNHKVIESNHKINTSVEVSLKQLPAFNCPTNRKKLSDFTVECKNNNGLVEYKLHKFILRQAPHFQKIFSAPHLIEPTINRTTIEKPKHLFEIILRYLYNQQPLKGISGIITDVILEASYFELNDFENDLWSLFEREADVTNRIKAINLIDVNTSFKIHLPNIMKRVAKNIKAVLQQINEVPDWIMVRTILNLECTKKQNPLLIFKSVKRWCKVHEPKNCEGRVHEIFSEVIKSRAIPQMIAKELVAKYPYLTDVKAVETPHYNMTETFLIHEGSSITVQRIYVLFGDKDVGVTKSGILTRKQGLKGEELRLHDQLSSHYIVVHKGTDLNQVVENIEEWKYGGYYRISISCVRPIEEL